MMRPPKPLLEEEQKLVEEYYSKFTREEMARDMSEEEAKIEDENMRKWMNSHASELLRLYWEFRLWHGDEGQLCDGYGNSILMDINDEWSWIQKWDVNTDGFCVFKGTNKLILTSKGEKIRNPVLDRRIEELYEREWASIPREWWDVKDGEVILTDEASGWLKKDYKEYQRKMEKMDAEAKDLIVDDRPRPKNPVISRIARCDLEELEILLFDK